MLMRGLMLNPSTEDMSRAVMLSCASGQLQVLKTLLKHGAQAGENAVWAACRACNIDAIKELRGRGLPFTRTEADICARSCHNVILSELTPDTMATAAPVGETSTVLM